MGNWFDRNTPVISPLRGIVLRAFFFLRTARWRGGSLRLYAGAQIATGMRYLGV